MMPSLTKLIIQEVIICRPSHFLANVSMQFSFLLYKCCTAPVRKYYPATVRKELWLTVPWHRNKTGSDSLGCWCTILKPARTALFRLAPARGAAGQNKEHGTGTAALACTPGGCHHPGVVCQDGCIELNKEYMWVRGLNGLDRKISQVRDTGLDPLRTKKKKWRSEIKRPGAASEGSSQTNSVIKIPGLFHRLPPTIGKQTRAPILWKLS